MKSTDTNFLPVAPESQTKPLRTDELTPGVVVIAKDMTRFTVDSVAPAKVDFRFQGKQADGTYASESRMEVVGHDAAGEAVYFIAAQSYLWYPDLNALPVDVPALLADNERLRVRVAELEAEKKRAAAHTERLATTLVQRTQDLMAAEQSPLTWAEKLDAKSLDNFLIALSTATEYEPMDRAIDEIHKLIQSYREDKSAETPYASRMLPPRDALCARTGCGHTGKDHHHGDTKCWAHLPKQHGGPVTVCPCAGFQAA